MASGVSTQADEEECTICLEGFSSAYPRFPLRGCAHNSFHQRCITEWSATSNYCPLCRAALQEFAAPPPAVTAAQTASGPAKEHSAGSGYRASGSGMASSSSSASAATPSAPPMGPSYTAGAAVSAMGGYAYPIQRPPIATGVVGASGSAGSAYMAGGAPGVGVAGSVYPTATGGVTGSMYPTATGGVTYVTTSSVPPTADQINSLLERTRQRLRSNSEFRDFTASVRAARHSHTGQLIENTARGAIQSGFNIFKGVGSSFLSAITGTPQSSGSVGTGGTTIIVKRGGSATPSATPTTAMQMMQPGAVVQRPVPGGTVLAAPAAGGYAYGYGHLPVPQQQQPVMGAPGRGGVRCPRCSNILLPPAGAPVFACPCGCLLRQ